MSEIDARDFVRLEAQVETLHGQVTQLSTDVKALLELANKGKGWFWMGMTIASIMGGVITFIADKLWKWKKDSYQARFAHFLLRM